MLKSLYFKLDDQNEKHIEIINFFNEVKSRGEKKIDVLSALIHLYYHGFEDNDK